METPFAMVYRVSPLTYLLGRSTVKVPHFAMVNLIAGRRVVPELVQQEFTAERVASEVGKIVPDGDARNTMLEGLRDVRRQLRGDGENTPAAERAAAVIMGLLRAAVSELAD